MINLKRRYKGFTFVEVLITVALFSIVTLAVFSTFASGMRLWRRIQEASFSSRRPLLVLEKIAQELRQTLNFSHIGVIGQSQEISFPVLSKKGEIIRVSYSLQEGSLVRSEESYTGILSASEQEMEGKARAILTGIEELNFSYASQDEGKSGYAFSEVWAKKESMPKVVKIELKTKNESFTKSVKIPVS